jgi:hypothetical protein
MIQVTLTRKKHDRMQIASHDLNDLVEHHGWVNKSHSRMIIAGHGKAGRNGGSTCGNFWAGRRGEMVGGPTCTHAFISCDGNCVAANFRSFQTYESHH